MFFLNPKQNTEDIIRQAGIQRNASSNLSSNIARNITTSTLTPVPASNLLQSMNLQPGLIYTIPSNNNTIQQLLLAQSIAASSNQNISISPAQSVQILNLIKTKKLLKGLSSMSGNCPDNGDRVPSKMSLLEIRSIRV